MCYYNGIKVTHGEYLRLKDLEQMISEINLPLVEGPLYNPDIKYPVLRPAASKDNFEVMGMEWGFLPAQDQWPFLKTRLEVERWRKGYKDDKGWHPGYTTLNATSEGLFLNDKGRKSMYADAAANRRVLIPSTGFFEWRHLPQIGKKGQALKAVAKYPYYIYPSGDCPIFYMAGIWNPWTDTETGEYTETFAIITAEANPLMAQIHNAKNRMPTILSEDLGYEWLFGDLSKERVLEIAATQYPVSGMAAHTVPKDFKASVDPTIGFEYTEVAGLTF